MTRQTKGILFATLASVGFGLGGAIMRLFFREFSAVSSIDVAFVRLFFGGAVFWILALIKDKASLRISGKDLLSFLALGIGGLFMVQFFLILALKLVNVALATFIQALSTVMIYGYGRLVTKESASRVKTIGLVLSMAGLFMMVWKPGMFAGESLFFLGIGAALLSAAGKSVYIIYGQRLQAQKGRLTLLAYGMLLGSLPALLFADPVRVLAAHYMDIRFTGMLLVYIIPCTILPYYFCFKGLELVSASMIGVVNVVEPVSATVGAFVLLGEMLTPLQVIGCALISAGIYLVKREIDIYIVRDGRTL